MMKKKMRTVCVALALIATGQHVNAQTGNEKSTDKFQ